MVINLSIFAINPKRFRGQFSKCFLFVCLFLAVGARPSIASVQDIEYPLLSISTEHFDSFRIADNAVLPSSRKVYLGDISVNFDSDWLKKFKGKVTSSYQNRIERDFSQMLREHVKNSLLAYGWTVVNEYEDGVLTIKAELLDLYISGPKTLNKQHVMVGSAGSSSIVIQVVGLDKRTFIEIEDKRQAGGVSGQLVEIDSTVNYSLFSKLTENWAKIFVAYLNISTPELSETS